MIPIVSFPRHFSEIPLCCCDGGGAVVVWFQTSWLCPCLWYKPSPAPSPQYLKMFWPQLTLLSLSLSLLCLREVGGFGTGAPQSACEGMRPGPPHGKNQARGTQSPFIVVAKKARKRSKQIKGRKVVSRFGRHFTSKTVNRDPFSWYKWVTQLCFSGAEVWQWRGQVPRFAADCWRRRCPGPGLLHTNPGQQGSGPVSGLPWPSLLLPGAFCLPGHCQRRDSQ